MRWLTAVVAVVVVVAMAGVVEGDVWAVLVAGSNMWYNYRHQADVCHAYQILHQHGVPDDHIIVMMYDDIANNTQNPTPGQIINRPGGPDVYKGVPKDYTGKDVTPKNFLKVLAGDAEGLKGVGSGKVLKSGLNDTVFINLVDHGAPGIFGFPHDMLHVRDFSHALKKMNRNKRYKEMVVYMEACESGSMFKKLPKDIKMYALSASNSHESSYACYYDKDRQTFLGDVFSIKWMEDTDRENVTKETLETQFTIVKNETKTSHVLQWGDQSLVNLTLATFLGNATNVTHLGDTWGPFPPHHDPCLNSSLPSQQVPVALIMDNIHPGLDGSDYWEAQLAEMVKNRTFVVSTMNNISVQVTRDLAVSNNLMLDRHDLIDVECHMESVQSFHDLCFNLGTNTFALEMVYWIVNLCEHGYTAQEFRAAAQNVCTHDPVEGIV